MDIWSPWKHTSESVNEGVPRELYPKRKGLPGLWVVHLMAWGTRLNKRRKGADTSILLALLPDCRFRGITFPSYVSFSPLWLTRTPRLLLKSLLLRCLAMAMRKISSTSHCPVQSRWEILWTFKRWGLAGDAQVVGGVSLKAIMGLWLLLLSPYFSTSAVFCPIMHFCHDMLPLSVVIWLWTGTFKMIRQNEPPLLQRNIRELLISDVSL